MENNFPIFTFESSNRPEQLKNNFLDTFTKFLIQLDVPVTESSALEYLETHPDEGSMLVYADALNHFKIENVAIKIKQEDLVTLPTPFIAFSQIHGGTFSVVKNLGENTIEWFDTQKGWVKDKLEDFTKTWSGVVLLAETDEKSGEKNYTSKRRNDILRNIRIPLAVILLTFTFLFFIINAPILSTPTYTLLGLKAIGMVISTLLFVKSIDNANSLVNKLCNAGSKISCQSILDSPAAKITPWFSWSDAGFIYFFGSFLTMLFFLNESPFLNSYFGVQMVLSMFSLLFSIYSIFYQGVKVQMWCTLCMSVLFIFFLEALLTFLTFSFGEITVDFHNLSNFTIGFLIPITFLMLFKQVVVKAHEIKSIKKDLTQLKSNPKIFEALMENQRHMPDIPEDMPVITIGNKNAKNTITMVSNPLCTPCAQMHARIEKILNESEDLKCQIIFFSSTDNHNSGGQFVRKVLGFPAVLHHSALHKWFKMNDNNFQKWNEDFLEIESKKEVIHVQKYHNDWAIKAEVKGTPTLFFNKKLLTNMVKVEDLGYFSKAYIASSSV